MSDDNERCNCLACQARRGELVVTFGDWTEPPPFIQALLDEIAREVNEAMSQAELPAHRDFGPLEI